MRAMVRAWPPKVGLLKLRGFVRFPPHTLARPSAARGSAMPDGLVWVQPEEQEQIARMRIALQDELAAALPELRHDHQFLRFLRGHGGFEKAVEKMRLY